MTTYASPLAEKQVKLAKARSNLQGATAQLAITQAELSTTENAIEQWAEAWPNIAERSDRPAFQGADGLAVHADGSPWMRDKNLQANTPDILRSPPPTHETIVDLRAAVTKAKKAEAAALKAEIKARAEWEPPSDTGWTVMKPKRIAGVQYAIGDAFDPRSVEPRQLERFKRVGLVVHHG